MQIQSASPKQVVFVIDDDPDVREGLRALLESVGFPCEAFASAKEFLNRTPFNAAGCLVLDVRLPGPSGFDLQKDLAKAHIDIPIIFITGHGDIPMSVRAMKGGAIEFLTKPLRDQDLLDAIRVALERDQTKREERDRLSDLKVRFETLSLRERTVLSLVTSGLLNKQIAVEMGLSEVTVKVHRHNLVKKMGATSVPDLVRMAEALQIGKD